MGLSDFEVGGRIGGGRQEQIFECCGLQFLLHLAIHFGKEKIHWIAGAGTAVLFQARHFTFHDAKNLPEGDLRRGFVEGIAPARTAPTCEQVSLPHGEQDLFEKFWRDVLSLADFWNGVELAGMAGKLDQRPEGVFAAF